MKTNKLSVGILASCLFLGSFPAQANLQSEINSWFDSGGYTNSTAPNAYQTQLGGFYTGGSFHARVPTRQIGGWVGFQPPKFEGGCGGIDLDLGGFNMVSKDEIVQQMRAIGQNAKSLAFSMAIKYISSLLGSTMETIKGYANDLNKLQLDSCQAATMLVDGTVDFAQNKVQKMKENKCVERMKSNSGLTEDEARARCTSGGARESQNIADGNKNGFTNGNLAWFMMMHVPWLQNDLEMAEIFMNLTGTVVINTDTSSGGGSAGSKAIVYPGGVAENCLIDCNDANTEAFLNRLVFGDEDKSFKGIVTIYRCESRTDDPLGCQEMANNGQPEILDMSGQPSIKSKLKATLTSIYAKVHDRDATLTNEEKAFLQNVSVPIYKYILASASAFGWRDSANDPMLDNYLDAVARNMVAINIMAISTEIKRNLAKEATTATDVYKEDYKERIDLLTSSINKTRVTAVQEMNAIMEMQQNAQRYERVIASRLSPGALASALFK